MPGTRPSTLPDAVAETSAASAGAETDFIAWRIGDEELTTGGSWLVPTIALTAFALVVLIAAPDELRLAGLVVAGLAGAGIAWKARPGARKRRRERLSNRPNIRLDERGVFWRSGKRWQGIERAQCQAFRIGPDPLTVRPVHSLTFQLAGGWESQPIELPTAKLCGDVRRYLVHTWKLAEQRESEDSLAARVTNAIVAACSDLPPAPEKRALLRSLLPVGCIAADLAAGNSQVTVAERSDPHGGESAASRWLVRFNRDRGDFHVLSREGELAGDFTAGDIGQLLTILRSLLSVERTASCVAEKLEAALVQAAEQGEEGHSVARDSGLGSGSSGYRDLAEFLARELAADVRLPLVSAEIEIERGWRGRLTIEGRLQDDGGTVRFWGEATKAGRGTGEVQGTIDASRDEDEQAAAERIVACARRLGFLAELVPHREELRLTAPTTRILQICDAIELAAATLKAPPAGARPRFVELGSDEMELRVGHAPALGMEGTVLWGDEQSLTDFAARIRQSLARAGEGETISLKVSPAPADRWMWIIRPRHPSHLFQTSDLYAEDQPHGCDCEHCGEHP